MKYTKRFNPTATEVFSSGGKTAYLTGRWFVRTWVKGKTLGWFDPDDQDNQIVMVEVAFTDDHGELQFDWWSDASLSFAQDGPVNNNVNFKE